MGVSHMISICPKVAGALTLHYMQELAAATTTGVEA